MLEKKFFSFDINILEWIQIYLIEYKYVLKYQIFFITFLLNTNIFA